ncbi:hypothetical protein BS47DRAFT_1486339 [Hydnum rufescens UP504]|uniref:Uncharacterized protein n=1 Tax=Hydnum rufescens UP504 TaxID=1448309 RepID=A0A9P6AUZ2_9AGAM|nr:hypothetical protein BS47DRAFT_1486339 [Hydnum rufescens UP504]
MDEQSSEGFRPQASKNPRTLDDVLDILLEVIDVLPRDVFNALLLDALTDTTLRAVGSSPPPNPRERANAPAAPHHNSAGSSNPVPLLPPPLHSNSPEDEEHSQPQKTKPAWKSTLDAMPDGSQQGHDRGRAGPLAQISLLRRVVQEMTEVLDQLEALL